MRRVSPRPPSAQPSARPSAPRAQTTLALWPPGSPGRPTPLGVYSAGSKSGQFPAGRQLGEDDRRARLPLLEPQPGWVGVEHVVKDNESEEQGGKPGRGAGRGSPSLDSDPDLGHQKPRDPAESAVVPVTRLLPGDPMF